MKLIQIAQLIISLALIIVILLQNQGSGLSGVFGGTGNIYRTKRGIEKTLFISTIIIAILFFSISLLSLVMQ
jgi:preprotein translocase subunit SecG